MSPTATQLGIDPEAIEAALDRNMTFPARWYSDPAIFDVELEHMFSRSWQLVAHEARIANPATTTSAGWRTSRCADARPGRRAARVRQRLPPPCLPGRDRGREPQDAPVRIPRLDVRARRVPARGAALRARAGLRRVRVLARAGRRRDLPRVRLREPGRRRAAARRGLPGARATLWTSRHLDFSDYRYIDRSTYEIPANWKVWVENATECYHCPTVHKSSFSDAWEVDVDVYEYVNVGGLLAQFTPYNPRAKTYRPHAGNGDGAADGTRLPLRLHVAGVVLRGRRLRRVPRDHHPDGPGELPVPRRFLRQPGRATTHFVDEWIEMYNRTIAEDAQAVLVQQPGLRSRMVPHGRLMPAQRELDRALPPARVGVDRGGTAGRVSAARSGSRPIGRQAAKLHEPVGSASAVSCVDSCPGSIRVTRTRPRPRGSARSPPRERGGAVLEHHPLRAGNAALNGLGDRAASPRRDGRRSRASGRRSPPGGRGCPSFERADHVELARAVHRQVDLVGHLVERALDVVGNGHDPADVTLVERHAGLLVGGIVGRARLLVAGQGVLNLRWQLRPKPVRPPRPTGSCWPGSWRSRGSRGRRAV